MTTELVEPSLSNAFHPSAALKPQRVSATLVALALFVVLNQLFGFVHRHHVEKDPGWANAQTVVSHYQQLIRAPDVVIIGSSIVRFPFWLSDLKHSAKVLKFDQYAWCDTLEEISLLRTKRPVEIFDCGIDAAMVSDVYLVCQRLFLGKKRPRLLIYGISPRDLMDNLLPAEEDTQVFSRLVRCADLVDTRSPFQLSPEAKAKVVLKESLPIYNHRREWQERVNSEVNKLIASDAPAIRTLPNASADYTQMPSALILPPKLTEDWVRSIAEYEVRYSHFDYAQFARQKKFLAALADLCRRRGIQLIVVNMPLTRLNERLMPPGLLPQYNSWLETTARCSGVSVLDLQNVPQFTDQSFFDVAHLNGEGGDLLTGILMPLIAESVRP